MPRETLELSIQAAPPARLPAAQAVVVVAAVVEVEVVQEVVTYNISQSEVSIQVTCSVLTNQRTVSTHPGAGVGGTHGGQDAASAIKLEFIIFNNSSMVNLTVQVAAQSWLAQFVAHLLWALAVRQHRVRLRGFSFSMSTKKSEARAEPRKMRTKSLLSMMTDDCESTIKMIG